jgi:small conductance mechanosensitive channel
MEEKTYIDHFVEFAWAYGPKSLGAIALFFGGLWVIKRLTRAFDVFLHRRKVDESLRPFFTSLTDMGMKVALVFMVANTIGIETTSFIAVFTAIAFSIGLALQGSLGNFASGMLILLFRPFKVGDLLTVSLKTGRVAEIQVFSTILKTQTGQKIIIPNSKITEGPIECISENMEVQVELALLLHSNTSLEKLRQVADETARRCPHALEGKSANVQVSGITRDDIKAEIAVWTMGKHYEATLDFMYEDLKNAFEEAGIELAKERRKEEV